jgi:hypothetical protein
MDRVDGKLERDAAGLADAVTDAARENEVMPVARGDVGP